MIRKWQESGEIDYMWSWSIIGEVFIVQLTDPRINNLKIWEIIDLRILDDPYQSFILLAYKKIHYSARHRSMSFDDPHLNQHVTAAIFFHNPVFFCCRYKSCSKEDHKDKSGEQQQTALLSLINHDVFEEKRKKGTRHVDELNAVNCCSTGQLTVTRK